MTKLTPFADDSASTTIGKVTIENGTDRIALYGSLDITADQQGLAHARALRTLLDEAIAALEARGDLPEAVPRAEAPKTVRNPFD